MSEREGELKSLLMKVKKESKKVSLRLNIQKTKIVTSSPITSWQIDGKLCIKMGISFLFSFAFSFSSFSAMCKASSDNCFASLHFFFLGMVLIAAAYTMSRTCMITHLEPDILEWEVKWALGSITTNKAAGGDGIPVELFQILKHDVVKVLHSVCQQIWKTQQWSQDWKKVSFHSNPKDGQCQKMFKLPHNCTHLTR